MGEKAAAEFVADLQIADLEEGGHLFKIQIQDSRLEGWGRFQ
jgi:hypothetical protein